MRNNLISKFIITLTLVAFLTVSVGKVNRVFALAELAPEIAPVYDTTIVQLSDYVENNLTQSQGDIFYILLGLALSGYAGSSDYELVNPYSSQGGVLNWLKDCGAQFYNTLITSPFTNGLFIAPDGTDMTKYVSTWLSISMGYAMKASAYTDVNDFLADLTAQDKYCIPFNYDSMYAINAILGQHGGLYNWQRRNIPLSEAFPFSWIQVNNTSIDAQYNAVLAGSQLPWVHVNVTSTDSSESYGSYQLFSNSDTLSRFHNLFIDQHSLRAYIVDDNGVSGTGYKLSLVGKWFYRSWNVSSTLDYFTINSLNISSYPTVESAINYVFSHAGTMAMFSLSNYHSNTYADLPCFITNIYYGLSWATRQEFINYSDLQFDNSVTEYFLTRQDDYLLDIKGLLEDLVDVTQLRPTFINNIYNPDGTGIDIEDLIKVSVDAIIQAVVDPPIPVDLNEISEYTENDYLDQLKEHAHDFSDTIGSYVAFWHNVDYELVYTVLGGVIIVMIGAFIGKWGHS